MTKSDDKGVAASGDSVSQAKSQSVAEQSDLDTNPIKYAAHDGKLALDAHDKPYMEMVYRSGKHSELVKKIMRQRIEMRAKEFPRWPAESTAGARLMWLESRFWYDRERVSPDFDNEWRAYRARYLHSLELHPSEPVHVPEYERQLLNPIRRFYMKPLDLLEDKVFKRFMDKYESAAFRRFLGLVTITWAVALGFCYSIRYNPDRWDSKFPMAVGLLPSRPITYPGHPDYPFKDHRTEPAHHFDIGFLRRNIFKDLRDYEDVSRTI